MDYLKVKNSWGALWGETGFFLLLRGKSGSGECGLVSGLPSYLAASGAVAGGSLGVQCGTCAIACRGKSDACASFWVRCFFGALDDTQFFTVCRRGPGVAGTSRF